MKPSLIRFLTYAAGMAAWTYIPIFAKELGVNDSGIGLIVAFYSVAFFFSSFIFGRASDKYGRRIFLLIGLSVTAIVFFLHVFAFNFISLLLVRALVGFCAGIYLSALVAYAYERKQLMGKFASFGSLGQGIGSLVAGIIASYFMIQGVFLFSSLFLLLSLFIALTLKPIKHKPINVPRFPIKIIKKNLSVYIPMLIRHSGAHIIWTFWPLYLLSLGADLFWIGVIQAINMITQFVVMYTVIDKLDHIKSIMLGLILSAITFFSFTLVSDFWQIMPTQVMLGFSWAFFYAGSLRYVTEKNVEKATVSGILESILSLSSIIGPFLATAIISFTGDYRITMYIASFLAFIGFFVFKALEHSRKSI